MGLDSASKAMGRPGRLMPISQPMEGGYAHVTSGWLAGWGGVGWVWVGGMHMLTVIRGWLAGWAGVGG